MELFSNSNEREWMAGIKALKVRSESLGVVDEKSSVKIVKDAFFSAVKNRIPKGRFGVLFSGGVDSSSIAFLCHYFGADFACFTVGAKGSKDLLAASKTAASLGLDLIAVEYADEQIKSMLKDTLKILPFKDVVNAGVGTVVYASCLLAKQEGISILFSGLGSEEIFAGYKRHELAENVNDECWSGLEMMWSRDLIRDAALSAHFGIDFRTPFLDPDLIVAAMRVDGKLKISGSEKKVVFRHAAHELGLPLEFAFRKKIAAQYGSGFDAAFERLARLQNSATKTDFLGGLLSISK